MKNSALTCLGVALAVVAANAETTYTYDDDAAASRSLTVYVPLDDTVDFDPTKFLLEGASVTNIIKTGEGRLQMRNADCSGLADKVFDVVVRAGTLAIDHGNCVGKSASGNTITVEDGATLMNNGGGNNCAIGNVAVLAQGRGYNDQGALVAAAYEWSSPFGGKLKLLGDTKMANNGTGGTIFSAGDYGGYHVDYDVSYSMSTEWSTFSNVGGISFVGKNASASIAMRKWINFDGDPEKVISFTNIVFAIGGASDTSLERGVRFGGTGRGFVSPLRFLSGSSILVNSSQVESFSRNTWKGPLQIDCPVLNFNVPANGGLHEFAFTNTVTGGGIALNGLDTTEFGLYLASNANSFTGGVHGTYANLHLLHGQALPADGGALALTNSTLTLESPTDVYQLPAAEFAGDSTVTGGVEGAFASLRKSGEGELKYDSQLGAEVLEVVGGSVDLAKFKNQASRSAVAGLIEGVISNSTFKTTGDDYSFESSYIWALNRTVAMPSNAVARGLNRLYRPFGSVDGPTSLFFYHCDGYIWNNSPTNETWAVASTLTGDFRIDLNGERVVAQANWWGDWRMGPTGFIGDKTAGADLGRCYLMLLPGANKFSFTLYSRIGAESIGSNAYYLNAYGDCQSSKTGELYEYWLDNCPLMFNRLGNASRNINDYEKLIDPGDGSLFTWAIPDGMGAAVNPLTAQVVKPQPKIAKAKFAANTVAKIGANEWWFDELEGWPAFDGTGDVLVREKWVFPGEETSEAAFALPGKLTFANDAKIEFSDGDIPVACNRGWITLGTAAGGINGKPVCTTEHWMVRVDGNALMASHAGPGFLIFIK